MPHSVVVDDRAFLAEFDRDWNRLEKELVTKFDDEVSEIFEQWMSTWARKYAIKKKVEARGYGAMLTTFIENSGAQATGSSQYDDRRARNNVPAYLNFGTAVRYAVMSNGFSPKTRAGLIQSAGGSGGSVTVGQAAMDGIEARKIDETAAEKIESMVDDIVADALDAVF